MYQIEFTFEQKKLPPVVLEKVEPNQSILEVALKHDINIHHNCGGVCACTTCHLYVNEGDDLLSELTDREEDYIDRAIRPTLQSRLSCQAMLKAKQSGTIKVKVPDQTQFLGE